jgi:Putative transposase
MADHVFPCLPVRQWVLSVPKRLRYFLQRDTALQGAVLRIFLRGVERCLRDHSPGCSASARIGAVAFIHRFGSSLNENVHFHCCIIDGVFESADATGEAADKKSGVVFHAASGLDAAALADVQAMVRRRILSAFVRRHLIDKSDAEVMGGWVHGGGFSLNASVYIKVATDRGWSACCATAPAHLSPWCTCNNWMPNTWSTTAPSRAPTGQATWCSPSWN